MFFVKNCANTRFIIVLQLIFLLLSLNTPVLHAHEYGHDADKNHPHAFFDAHISVGHADDHDHEDSILGEEFEFASDFHTHDTNAHTHLFKNILNIFRANKNFSQKTMLILWSILVENGPNMPNKAQNLHTLYNHPHYKDKALPLSFTDLPPPQL